MSEGFNHPGREGSPRGWVSVGFALLFAVFFLVWCGAGGTDLRYVLPWAWSEEGWVIPSRGLALVMMAGCVVYAVLSRVAYRLMTDFPAPRIGVVGAVGVCIRTGSCIAGGCGAAVDAVAVGCGGTRNEPSADDDCVAVVDERCRRADGCSASNCNAPSGRSAWWVALYAFHPLTLMEIAGNGSWISLGLLPLAVLAASGGSLPKWVQWITIAICGIAAVGIVGAMTSAAPFDSVASLIPFMAGGQEQVALPLIEAILQGIVLLVAWRRGWRFERALSHVVLMMLFGMSAVKPAMALGVLVLLPLAWNRAGWVLSLTALVGYAAVPAMEVTHRWGVPGVLVMLAWVPVVIVELQELAVEGIRLRLPAKKNAAGETIGV